MFGCFVAGGKALAATNNNLILKNKIVSQKEHLLYVPILMYHHIADRKIQNPYFVSPQVFDQQMAWLKNNNYQVITYSDFYQALMKTKTLPPKAVVITFDDGDVDQYHNAVPILKKYGYSAMFYITTNFIGHEGWMNWSMLQGMVDSGFEIGGHTMSHPNLAKLTLSNQMRELVVSKQILEKHLKTKVDFFAYPGGAVSTSTVSLLKEEHYLSAVTTRHSVFHSPNENPYLVSRIHIDDDLQSFILFVEGKKIN